MRKFLSVFATLALCASLAACGSSSTSSGGGTSNPDASSGTSQAQTPVEISFLVTKPEIVPQFQETFAKFSAEESHITISAIPLSGQTIYEKLTALYASKNAPTITMVGGAEFSAFQENFLDVTNTAFAQKVYDWAKPKSTVDGKLLAVPTTAEGIGITYNQTVIEAATGRAFDPASIKNRKDFAALLEEISKTEYAPVQLSNMDWLLGSHLTSVLFGAVSPDHAARQDVIAASKNGTYDFASSEAFNGFMDTFDLMMKYNAHKDSPLASAYEDDQMSMASDEVAFWPIGNYVYPNILAANPDAKVGLMPYPMGDSDDTYGNKEIVLTYSMFAIDGKQSSEAQQKAAISFFDWLVTSDAGQDAYINTLQFTPVYKDFRVEVSTDAAKQLNAFMEAGNTLDRMSDYYPAGAMNLFGATMQQYLDGVVTREQVADQFAKDWKESAAKQQ